MECIELFLLVSFPLIHVYGIQLITAYAVMFEGGRFSVVIKKYVYSHPINVFIIGKLGLSVEVFCELYGFKQGTLSSWITREREVADLPISFLYALSLASVGNMNEVYDCLCEYEKEYKEYLKISAPKRNKKYIED